MATTEIYTLSLHDALPISDPGPGRRGGPLSIWNWLAVGGAAVLALGVVAALRRRVRVRSEEHTSELQSLTNIVCGHLLEKKKDEEYQLLITKHLQDRGRNS